MKKTIFVDVDEVVANLIDAWLFFYNRDYDDNLTREEIKEWDISKFVKPQCGERIFDYLFPKIYDLVQPVHLALCGINFLRDTGYDIVFATTVMHPKAFGRKFSWLNDYGFKVDFAHYIEVASKGLLRGELLIDDAIHNLESFQGDRILFDAPWNKEDRKFSRARGWVDVVALIKNKEMFL